MTLLVPTTSGGWKADAVVAQSAAAAAAFVGDLTIFERIRAFCELSELARVLHCGETARDMVFCAVLPYF